MNETTLIFDEVPAGAVFEASVNSLTAMNYHLSETDQLGFRIKAYPKDAPWHATKQIELQMLEVGRSTRLLVSGALLRSSSVSEAADIIRRLSDSLLLEIQKIRDSGRIVPVEAPKYSFGQVTSTSPAPAPPPPAPPAPAVPQVVEIVPAVEKKSGGHWLAGVAFTGALFFAFNTEMGRNLVDEVLGSITLETDVSKYDCHKIAALIKGEEISNIFGAKFTILRARDLVLVSKTDEKVTCTAVLDLSNASEQPSTISVEKGASRDEILYMVEPIL